MESEKRLSLGQREEILGTLKIRFEKNMNRHNGLEWDNVLEKLEANPEKLWSLNEMERTGGEPDVVGFDEKAGDYIFLIVRLKAQKDVEVFATTGKPWSQGSSTNRKPVPWIWLLTSVLRF